MQDLVGERGDEVEILQEDISVQVFCFVIGYSYDVFLIRCCNTLEHWT